MIWQGRIIQPIGSGDRNPTGGNGATNPVGDDSERGDTHADSSKKRWPCLKDACAAVAKVAMNELAVFPTELMDKFTQLEQFSRLCHGLGWKYEVVETEPAILVRACVRKPPR